MFSAGSFKDAYSLYRPAMVIQDGGSQIYDVPSTATAEDQSCRFFETGGRNADGGELGPDGRIDAKMIVPYARDIRPHGNETQADIIEITSVNGTDQSSPKRYQVARVTVPGGSSIMKVCELRESR